MEKIRILNQEKNPIGVISFDNENNLFNFKYDDSFKGYPFGEINCNEGREFSSSTLFSLFAYPDSFNRKMIVNKHGIDSPDSNEAQWFFLKLWAEKGECIEGLYYEGL